MVGATLLALPAQAQLTFPGAAPISSGNVIVRAQPELVGYSGDAQSVLQRDVLIYGASPNLALIVQNNSLVANTANVVTAGRTQRETALGLGDTLLEARYTVWQQDGVGSTFRIAPYLGVSAPTGMDNVNGAIGRAGQPGTGTWGSRDALTMSYQALTWNGGAEIGYQANGADAGYRFGNTFYADAGIHYLLWPNNLEGAVPAELYASLEANYTSTVASATGASKVYGTGGQMLLVDPGLIYTRADYSISAVGFLPAFQSVRDNGTRFVFGAEMLLRLSFFTSYHW